MEDLFAIILSSVITYGFTKAKMLINERKINKIIKKRIQADCKYWTDLTMDEIKKGFNIPENYKGSKEELIENIVYNKAYEYKEEIIEKIREKKKG